ncbi:MAG: heme biosynthesis protein HemY [Ideonella sp.]|jgi:HemY protein|nr:heme biosynthesis protein HemY [Ideonella sp.]
MRWVIGFILIFVAAVVAAGTLGTNDGLVTISWGHWRTELSLNLFLLGLVVACTALVITIQAMDSLLRLPRRAREWRVGRRDRLAQTALRDALAQYFGGRYSRAQRAARKALAIQADTPDLRQDPDFAVLAHLLAAGSAHRLQDRPGRDAALRDALDLARRQGSGRPAEEGARLLAAEWALDDRDAARALTMLGELPPGVARRTQALRLRLQAARLARQPLDALKTARLLAKHQAFSPAAAASLVRTLAYEALEAARDADQLRRVWQQLEPADRRDAHVAARAAQRAAALGAPEDGRGWLRPFWDQIRQLGDEERTLVARALGEAADGIGGEWLPRLQAATEALPQDAAVAYATGVVMARRELWGMAQRHLERAAADAGLDPGLRRRAWRLLATLAERVGDTASAERCRGQAAAVD